MSNWVWVSWVIGVISTITAATGIILSRKGLKPRRLFYDLRANQEVIPQSTYSPTRDFLVKVGEHEFKNARVVGIRVTNAGRDAAGKNMFAEALRVVSPDDGKFRLAKVLFKDRNREEPEEIEYEMDEGRVEAPKLLLNPEDWLEFHLLIEGGRLPPKVEGHVENFTIEPFTPKKAWSQTQVPVLIFFGGILATAALTLILYTLIHGTTTTQSSSSTSTFRAIPPCPSSPTAAAAQLGVEYASAHFVHSSAGCGWHTGQPLQLTLFFGACVDHMKGLLRGDTEWTEVGPQGYVRTLMSGPGNVTGPATVYWTTDCPKPG